MPSLRDKLGLNNRKRVSPQGGSETAKPVVKIVASYRCGHQENINALANRDCPDCVKKARMERIQRDIEKRKNTKIIKDQSDKFKTRLPDCSCFQLSFDAEKVLWFGTLTILHDGGPLTFKGENSAVFKLLSQLDDQWREYLLAKTKK